jgi:hypothetical protein
MTYDLRRLRLHGLIRRIPRTHRYELTPFGLRSALFLTRVYCRILRPGMSQLTPGPKFWRRSRQPTWGSAPALPPRIAAPLRNLEHALDQWRHRAKLAARSLQGLSTHGCRLPTSGITSES